ncbi:MAG: FAD binding domain-containing protein [Acidimicrobiia bacterium]|nr:FAD binding domain-containing protein [Acidimicrobiia bacterium]
MHQFVGYHRPKSIADAAGLLERPNRMALAGGTTISHDGGGTPIELVDLQSLGLSGISANGSQVEIGATATLQALVDSDLIPDLIRDTAKAEQPSTLRGLATVGGSVGAADGESVLVAALLVHEATVAFADERSVPLEEVLADGLSHGDLIVSVSVATGGATAMAATGRTPRDVPIVAAVGRIGPDGTRLAVCGVGPVPQLVTEVSLGQLDPPGDFRGSAAYRMHLAEVLTARVLGELS